MISGVDLELTETSPAAPPNGATGTPPTPALFTAKSGSDGKFAIRNVPSGTYKLVAAGSGGNCVPFEYAQRGNSRTGMTFPLGEGQQISRR